jgi:hypothetical protein
MLKHTYPTSCDSGLSLGRNVCVGITYFSTAISFVRTSRILLGSYLKFGSYIVPPFPSNSVYLVSSMAKIFLKVFYNPFKINRRFRGIFRLHLRGQRISRVRNQHESMWQAERLAWL